MKKTIIVVISILCIPTVVHATGAEKEGSSLKSALGYKISFSHGALGSGIDLSFMLNSNHAIGLSFEKKEYGNTAGIRFERTFKKGFVRWGFHGGFNLGPVVMDAENTVSWDSAADTVVSGYRKALTGGAGIYAGIEFPVGFGFRFNIGSDIIIVSSEKENFVDETGGRDPDFKDKMLINAGIQIYYRF